MGNGMIATSDVVNNRAGPTDSRYPLTLISPATAKTINSMFGEFAPPPAVLSIHPDDAAPRGLVDNATVRVWNDQASIELPCSLDRVDASRRVRHPEGAVAPQPAGRADGQRVRAGHDLRPRGGACFNDARVDVAPSCESETAP